MYCNNKALKVITVIITILFTFNSISWAMPGGPTTLQKESALRGTASGGDGQTPAAIGAELLKTDENRAAATNLGLGAALGEIVPADGSRNSSAGQAAPEAGTWIDRLRELGANVGKAVGFPVKIVDSKQKGIDVAKKPDNAEVLYTSVMFVKTNGTTGPVNITYGGIAPREESEAVADLIFRQGVSELVNRTNHPGDERDKIITRTLSIIAGQNVTIPLQIVKDNDKLVDFANISDDVRNPQMGVRFDVELADALGITQEDGELRALPTGKTLSW